VSKGVTRLIKNLSHRNVSVRRSAAEALSNADERAVYPLMRALRDVNPGVQDAAMRALISIGGEVTAYMVLPLLRDEACLRNMAMIILKDIGRDAVPLLRSLFRDKDDDVRKFAVDLLSDIGYCDYPEKITHILQSDPNINVRASAAKAIGLLHYKDAVPELIAALKDKEWVCFSALESLALIKDEAAVEPILSLLDSPFDSLRFAAIEALGRIGSDSSSNPLIAHLHKTAGFEKKVTIRSLIQIGITPSMSKISDVLLEMFTNSDDWDEKFIALKGLIGLKEDRAIYHIIDFAGSLDPSNPENEEKLHIIKELLCNSECSDSLIGILSDPTIRYRGRQIAIEVLGDQKCRKAIPHLLNMCENKFGSIRRAAITALGAMNEKDFQQTFIDTIEDHDGHVRREAVSALGKIGDKTAIQSILKILHVEKYRDVLEEAVRSVLTIDSSVLLPHLHEFNNIVKEIIAKCSHDLDILLFLSREEDVRIRASALLGLGKVRNEDSYNRLKEAIYDEEPEIRRATVQAMGELNCCHNEITSALKDQDMQVRLYAVHAFGRSSQKDTIHILIPMLSDKEIPVVLSAIDAISQFGGEKSLGALHTLLNHAEGVVREKAQQAIDSCMSLAPTD